MEAHACSTSLLYRPLRLGNYLQGSHNMMPSFARWTKMMDGAFCQAYLQAALNTIVQRCFVHVTIELGQNPKDGVVIWQPWHAWRKPKGCPHFCNHNLVHNLEAGPLSLCGSQVTSIIHNWCTQDAQVSSCEHACTSIVNFASFPLCFLFLPDSRLGYWLFRWHFPMLLMSPSTHYMVPAGSMLMCK